MKFGSLLCTILSIVTGFFLIQLLCALIRRLVNRPFDWLLDDEEHNQQWAVITGTCKDGIGYEFARQLAYKGYNILLIGWNDEDMEKTKDKILDSLEVNENVTVAIESVGVDFTKDDIYAKVNEFLNVDETNIYVLVNNVTLGPSVPKAFLHESRHGHHELISANVMANTRIIELILPNMVKRKRGLVINVASITAQHPTPLECVFAATKAYISHLSQCLANEFRDSGLTFVTLYPGVLSTSKKSHSSGVPSAKKYVASALASIRYRASQHITGYPSFDWLNCSLGWIRFFRSRDAAGRALTRYYQVEQDEVKHNTEPVSVEKNNVDFLQNV